MSFCCLNMDADGAITGEVSGEVFQDWVNSRIYNEIVKANKKNIDKLVINFIGAELTLYNVVVDGEEYAWQNDTLYCDKGDLRNFCNYECINNLIRNW